MRGHEHQDWVQRARAVPIKTEIERRGIKLQRIGLELVGACPKCGGDDRFAINIKKGVFNCRGCDKGGDVIALVEHLDGVDFNTACTQLTGQPPPQKANGKANGKHAGNNKKVVVATFEYQNQDGSVAFAVDRIQFQEPFGSAALIPITLVSGFIIKRAPLSSRIAYPRPSRRSPPITRSLLLKARRRPICFGRGP
jgi:hypothetical protein